MRVSVWINAGALIVLALSYLNLSAQISPGDLSEPHAYLEGITNCTQCHVLGNKVSGEKCLACHTEIQSRKNLNKGYHSSKEINGKECFTCHSDHHGKNFQLVRMDIKTFDHNMTGYSLSAPHAKRQCIDCHTSKYILDKKITSKKYSYLGLGSECLSCHADYHQKTLSSICLDCHNPGSFKPATKFNHENVKFQLVGKHKTVECIKCHKVEMKDGKKFQLFQVINYTNCVDCHKDPHQNKFGPNCSQCHNEESFKSVKVSKNFNHNKTSFVLADKHLSVNCQACHRKNFTDPLKHEHCTDCHADYHKKQFAKSGVNPDCSQCHDVKGFKLFTYTIEQHRQSAFPLQGAHEAVPCIDCHKKEKEWSFRRIGISCIDCHKNIHEKIIAAQYYPEANCKLCHSTYRWKEVSFDHSKTEYLLTGAHVNLDCRACHYKKDVNGMIKEKFDGLGKNCSDCHNDVHYKQFEKNGVSVCEECHATDSWKATKFNHNNTLFKLDGKHVNVPCAKCHTPQKDGTDFYIKYKLKEFKCESCHL
jgi:hypothetical protein